MFPRFIAIAAVLAALGLPASAAAKEITKVTICGQGGCHSTDDRDRLATLPVGGTPTDPPRAAPFYRVTVHMRESRPMSFRMYFLPHPGLLRESAVHGSWTRPSARQAAALASLARGLKPFGATQLPYSLPPLATPAPSEGGGFPWPIVLAAVLGIGGAALAVRLRVHGRGPATE
jgi:hypothetical protein